MFTRIDKRAARAAFAQGLTVFFCPVKLYPTVSFNPAASINNNIFDTFDDAFRAWQEQNNLKRCKFYISSGKV